MTRVLCFLAVVPIALAAGCSEKESPRRTEKPPRAESHAKQKPSQEAREKPKTEPSPAAHDAGSGSLPTSKSVTQKKLQDTREAEVTVTLRVIYASKERKNVDPRIKEIAALLTKEFKEYELTNFVQLDNKELKLAPSQTVPVQLPGERRLEITNRGIRDKKIVLGLEMAKFIKTTVLLSQKGKVTLGGPKYKFGKGMIVLFVKARSADK
jgi:hypothetical protein